MAQKRNLLGFMIWRSDFLEIAATPLRFLSRINPLQKIAKGIARIQIPHPRGLATLARAR